MEKMDIYDRVRSVPDNPLYDQYKSRSVANYSQALKSLIDAKHALERGKNG